jgi:hypothetical protein
MGVTCCQVSLVHKSLRTLYHQRQEVLYPEGHRFMQDNDPKHTSNLAKEFMQVNSINWWKWPSESCDLNPIESILLAVGYGFIVVQLDGCFISKNNVFKFLVGSYQFFTQIYSFCFINVSLYLQNHLHSKKFVKKT